MIRLSFLCTLFIFALTRINLHMFWTIRVVYYFHLRFASSNIIRDNSAVRCAYFMLCPVTVLVVFLFCPLWVDRVHFLQFWVALFRILLFNSVLKCTIYLWRSSGTFWKRGWSSCHLKLAFDHGAWTFLSIQLSTLLPFQNSLNLHQFVILVVDNLLDLNFLMILVLFHTMTVLFLIIV